MNRLAVLVLIGSAHLVCPASNSKLAPDVPKLASNQLYEVIVQFKSTGSSKSNGQGNNSNGQNQNGDFDNDVQQIGQHGQVKTQLPKINAVHMQMTLAEIQALQTNPAVAYVSPNRFSKGALDITTQTVAANLAWQFGYTGAGVGVAVIDSGITPRHDLTGPNGVTSHRL